MAKVCRKHKISFNGLRCPKCSAPPVIAQDDPDEQLPFNSSLSLGTEGDALQVLEILSQDSSDSSADVSTSDPSPDFSGFGGGDTSGGGASNDF